MKTTDLIKEIRQQPTWNKENMPRLRELVMELIKRYEFLDDGLTKIVKGDSYEE